MNDAVGTLKNSIIKLTEEKKYAALRDVLSTMNSADIAALFEEEIPEETLVEILVEILVQVQKLLL